VLQVTNTYTDWGELASAKVGATTYTYGYNGEGNRIQKGTTSKYVYDGIRILFELNSSNNVVASNVYGTNQISRTSGSNTGYYLYNGHGDVVEIADIDGDTLNTYKYDAFGNIETETGTFNNPFKYAGYYYDTETGNYYLINRYYNSRIGRFISEDTIRSGLNWYVYTDNNPINRWDYNGREWTAEDQENYLHLISEGRKSEAEDFKFAINLATRAYELSQKSNELFYMNEARYMAVQERQGIYNYEDTYDYTHGKDVLTFLGVHPVGFEEDPFHHSSIIIFVSPKLSYDSTVFRNSAWGGAMYYATIGAGSEGGNLISGINREKDIDLTTKNEMKNLYVYDVESVNKLFALERYYYDNQKNIDYDLFPDIQNSYNSNSFAHWLLDTANIPHNKPESVVPGWRKPLDFNLNSLGGR
jgi:RHS repeat-associated protein